MVFLSSTLPGQSHPEAILMRLREDERKVVACERKLDEAAKVEGVRRIPVAGHCLSGCPVHLPKPIFPEWARRNRWTGSVLVDVIADTEGKVVSSRLISGPEPFRQPSLDAARRSMHSPRTACGERIFFRWQITYIFIL
jgi:hypothetical protein